MGARDPSPTSLDLSPRIQSQTKDFPLPTGATLASLSSLYRKSLFF